MADRETETREHPGDLCGPIHLESWYTVNDIAYYYTLEPVRYRIPLDLHDTVIKVRRVYRALGDGAPWELLR